MITTLINCHESDINELKILLCGEGFPTVNLFIPFRNAFLRKRQTIQLCVFSGVVLFASTTVMLAADDGISPSMVLSALLQRRLMVWFTWYTEMALRKIYTACDKSRACVKKFTMALCAWDSGSVTVLVTDLLTRTRVGTQCPGSTWKRYHPHRLKGKQIIELCS